MICPREPVTMTALKKVPLARPPGAGFRWEGVPHHVLLTELACELVCANCQLDEQVVGLSSDGGDMAACLRVRVPGVAPPPGIESLSLGLVTSNARRLSTRAYAGVETATEGVPLELAYRGLHTPGGVRDLAREVVTGFLGQARRLPALIERMRRKQVPAALRRQYLVGAGREGWMPWSRIGDIEEAFGSIEQTSSWDLLTRFALVARKNPVLSQLGQVYCFKRSVNGEWVKEDE